MLTKIKQWLTNNRFNIAVIFAIFVLDRITKEITLRTVAINGPAEIFRYFSFTYAENTGVAFSMFRDGNFLLIFVMVAILIFILKSWREIAGTKKPWGNLGLCFIFGGALGNLYDRIFLGFVVDMLDFKVWPIFNVADSFVCVGAVLIFIAMFLGGKKEQKELK